MIYTFITKKKAPACLKISLNDSPKTLILPIEDLPEVFPVISKTTKSIEFTKRNEENKATDKSTMLFSMFTEEANEKVEILELFIEEANEKVEILGTYNHQTEVLFQDLILDSLIDDLENYSSIEEIFINSEIYQTLQYIGREV